MRRLLKFIFPACFGSVALFADKAPFQQAADEELPWLTGPLIAQSSEVIERGHANIEPYLFATANTGFYQGNWHANKIQTLWNFLFQPEMIFGLTQWMDILILPTISYNVSGHAANWGWNDPNISLEFQLYRDDNYDSNWIPNIKFALRETFPMGKYDKLDPRKNKTQISGGGAFVTQAELAIGKLFHFTGVHFMSARLVTTYSLPTAVRSRGFSVYGGGTGADARVYVPQSLNIDLAFEFTFTQNWAFAIDLIGNWAAATRFKGDAGTRLNGTPSTLELGPGFSFTLAPAIEYNWNSQLGLIAGVWFSAAGKNTPQFFSPAIALNYYR